MSLHKSSHKIC